MSVESGRERLARLDREMFGKKMYGGVGAPETNDYAKKCKKFKITVCPTGESQLLELKIPDSYWTVFLPRLDMCASAPFMTKFDGSRHLHSLETGDLGFPFFRELCACNPAMLNQIIHVAEQSLTMLETEDDVLIDTDTGQVTGDLHFMNAPTPIKEHRENHADASGVTTVHEGREADGYKRQCLRETGHGFSQVSGVRVLIHRFKTEAGQMAMDWHTDDLYNMRWDGGYAVATVMLPGSASAADSVCTEISGLHRAVDPNCGLWVPCNVMHRGVTTQAAPRHCIMLEFIAYGRSHSAAADQNHRAVKDWLGLNMSQLLEMKNTPPLHQAVPGSMPYIRDNMPNPYIVEFGCRRRKPAET